MTNKFFAYPWGGCIWEGGGGGPPIQNYNFNILLTKLSNKPGCCIWWGGGWCITWGSCAAAGLYGPIVIGGPLCWIGAVQIMGWIFPGLEWL